MKKVLPIIGALMLSISVFNVKADVPPGGCSILLRESCRTQQDLDRIKGPAYKNKSENFYACQTGGKVSSGQDNKRKGAEFKNERIYSLQEADVRVITANAKGPEYKNKWLNR